MNKKQALADADYPRIEAHKREEKASPAFRSSGKGRSLPVTER